MLYVKFLIPILLWAWIVSSTYSRYISPRVGQVLDFFMDHDKLREQGLQGVNVKIASFSVQTVAALTQMYVLGIWSVYCVLRTIHYTHLPGVEHPWIYHVSALFLCEAALGVIAYRENYRGILSILHSVGAMGMFGAFSIDPYDMIPIYSWMVSIMDKNGLFS